MRCGYFEENFPLLARQLATAEFITPACYATMLTSVLFIVCLFGALSFGAAISTKSCSLQSILGSDVSSTLVQAPLPTSSLLKVAMMRAGASSKTVRDISSPAEFDKLLQSAGKGKLVVVDFTATWCGPCKMISPMYQQLSELYTKAVFVKVDVDQGQDIAAKYDVKSMPTFLFLKDGKVVARFSGASVDKLTSTIKQLI